jgi:hypothetical protein
MSTRTSSLFLLPPSRRFEGSTKPLLGKANDQVAGTASAHLLLKAPVLTGVAKFSEEDRVIMSKLKALESDSRAEVLALLDAKTADATRKRHNAAFVDAISQLANEPFSRIWDNPKDAEYDDL